MTTIVHTHQSWLGKHSCSVSATQRLFCLPYAGGNATIFREWASRLPEFVDVIPLHPPGRGSRFHEPLLWQMDEIVEQVTAAIAPLLDKPYILFGHSMGASVAYEVARSIAKQIMPAPKCLIVAGRKAPHLPKKRTIHHLPDEQFLDEIIRMDGTPEVLMEHPEIIDLILPVLRADFTAIETYQSKPDPPLNCRIVALDGSEESGSEEAVESWRGYTTDSFRREIVPGGHFFLRGDARRMFEIINEELRLNIQK